MMKQAYRVLDDQSDDLIETGKPVIDAGVLSDSAKMTACLVKVAKFQDKQAFAQLFDWFAPRIKAYMFRLGSSESEAEELAQQALVQVWRKARLFNPDKAAASTWIFRVARNLRTDHLRKQRFVSAEDEWLNAIEDEGDSPETLVDRQQQVDIMRKALETLPSDQAEVIRLSFYKGLSHGEIAEQLQLPPGTVKSRMRLAYEKLRVSAGVLS